MLGAHSTSWPLEASSAIICRMVLYCDPPTVQKPAIRAQEAPLTASERRSRGNNAILAVNWQIRKVVLNRLNPTLYLDALQYFIQSLKIA